MNTFELCLSIEQDLEKYYMEQAEKNEDTSLKKVFAILADDEKEHLKLLEDNKEQVTAPIKDNDIIEEAKNLFKNIGDIETFKADPSQVETYRHMLKLEEKTRDFYKVLKDREVDPERKKVFEFLQDGEDKHCIILEEIIKLTERPEEWVESAEFGIREDY